MPQKTRDGEIASSKAFKRSVAGLPMAEIVAVLVETIAPGLLRTTVNGQYVYWHDGINPLDPNINIENVAYWSSSGL
jgi:hypothetical protein